jgi:recombination protein RecT
MSAMQTDPRQRQLKDLLTRSRGALQAVLPKHLDAERMVRVAMMASVHQPKLLESTAQSILLAVMQAAQLGLEIGGALGHCWLVPFKGVAQFIPGYRGLIDLARRSKAVWAMEARAVFDGDKFDWAYGLYPKLEHKPIGKTRELTHVYAVARMDQGNEFDVMDREDVDAIRSFSRARDSGPWVSHYTEMAKKTVVRRICKMLPLSVELAAAVEADNRFEGAPAESNDLLDGIAIPELEAPLQAATSAGASPSLKERVAVAAVAAKENTVQ